MGEEGFKDEGLDKENWRRSDHVLMLLTEGQINVIKGQQLQNPWYCITGCSEMLQVIGPLLRQSVYEEKTDEETGEKEKRKVHYKGINTPKYKEYVKKIAKAVTMVNAGMNPSIQNRYELLNISYGITNNLCMELLQDASDLGFDFMAKDSPHDAWKH